MKETREPRERSTSKTGRKKGLEYRERNTQGPGYPTVAIDTAVLVAATERGACTRLLPQRCSLDEAYGEKALRNPSPLGFMGAADCPDAEEASRMPSDNHGGKE
jgi:hypothetical protein